MIFVASSSTDNLVVIFSEQAYFGDDHTNGSDAFVPVPMDWPQWGYLTDRSEDLSHIYLRIIQGVICYKPPSPVSI